MRDTAHLSIMEHGAYNIMLDHCYATEKPLPGDFDALYRLCRAMSKPEQEAVRKVVRGFFVLKDDEYHNPRADREIATAQGTIAKQRQSGAEASAKRWAKDGSTDGSTDEPENGSTGQSTNGSTGKSAIQPPTTNHQPPDSNHQPPAASTSTRGTRLAPDWTLPDDWANEAISIQATWTPNYCQEIAAAFRDYWIAQPGQRGIRTDWSAVWRNWARKEGPAKPNGNGGTHAMTPYQQMQVEKHAESKRFTEAIHGKRSQQSEPIDITPARLD